MVVFGRDCFNQRRPSEIHFKVLEAELQSAAFYNSKSYGQ